VLEILAAELDSAPGLCGLSSVAEADRSLPYASEHMRLLPLFTMTLGQPERTVIGPLEGGDSIVFGAPSGEVTGERLQGQIHAVNTGRFRADGVNLPDTRGVITTSRGAHIYFELRGYAIPQTGGSPIAVTASIVFRTDAEEVRWLNRVFALAEAVFESSERVTYSVYECVAER
jgi:hypothetical protein